MMPQCHTPLGQHSRRPASSSSSSSSRHRQRQPVVLVRAAGGTAGGFGRSNKKKVATDGGMVVPQKFKGMQGSDLSDDSAAGSSRGKQSAAGAPPGFPADWVDLRLKASDFPMGKNAKPVELVGRAVMVYKFDGRVFVSDAASTAYQFPMTDARLAKDEAGRVTAEVPLDGTIYDLSTGAVLKWCPADNPVRGLLGTLKSKADPTPLKVYPVHVTGDGSIYTKLLV